MHLSKFTTPPTMATATITARRSQCAHSFNFIYFNSFNSLPGCHCCELRWVNKKKFLIDRLPQRTLATHLPPARTATCAQGQFSRWVQRPRRQKFVEFNAMRAQKKNSQFLHGKTTIFRVLSSFLHKLNVISNGFKDFFSIKTFLIQYIFR